MQNANISKLNVYSIEKGDLHAEKLLKMHAVRKLMRNDSFNSKISTLHLCVDRFNEKHLHYSMCIWTALRLI